MTTLREIHERCKARHSDLWTHPATHNTYCVRCDLPAPCDDYTDAQDALAILDDAEETEARVTTPSEFKVYKLARIVSDWTPGKNEPPAHGWPDPEPS